MSDLLERYREPRTRWWAVMAGFASGRLSEGQACKLLDVSPLDLRESVTEFEDVCSELWDRYRANGMTVCTDISNDVHARASQLRSRHGGD